jgi:hypothetical protein
MRSNHHTLRPVASVCIMLSLFDGGRSEKAKDRTRTAEVRVEGFSPLHSSPSTSGHGTGPLSQAQHVPADHRHAYHPNGQQQQQQQYAYPAHPPVRHEITTWAATFLQRMGLGFDSNCLSDQTQHIAQQVGNLDWTHELELRIGSTDQDGRRYIPGISEKQMSAVRSFISQYAEGALFALVGTHQAVPCVCKSERTVDLLYTDDFSSSGASDRYTLYVEEAKRRDATLIRKVPLTSRIDLLSGVTNSKMMVRVALNEEKPVVNPSKSVSDYRVERPPRILRDKPRMSYTFGVWRVDTTEVTQVVNGKGKTVSYEVEIELRTLDANLRAQLCQPQVKLFLVQEWLLLGWLISAVAEAVL